MGYVKINIILFSIFFLIFFIVKKKASDKNMFMRVYELILIILLVSFPIILSIYYIIHFKCSINNI